MKKVVASHMEDLAYEGWDTSIDELVYVIALCQKVASLQYELERCVRGSKSMCTTYKQLADFIINLGNELAEAGENLEANADYHDRLDGVDDE